MHIENLYQLYLQSKLKVSTDTRKITQGSIFFALKGANFDGNRFATSALEKGAAYAVVDDAAVAAEDERILLVKDALSSLQELANYHRKQLKAHVLAITGSNGKTTTKELVHQVLASQYKTLATPGNFNNHIGLPLTILQTQLDTEILILEMGDNNLGEIAELCQIGMPNSGLITNIGKDHLEGFGSFENNLRAKSELFDYLLKHQGTPFINTKDPIVSNMAKRFHEPVLYGSEPDFAHLNKIEKNGFISFSLDGVKYDTHLFGDYNFANVEAAHCIGKYFKVPNEKIAKALSEYKPKNNRSQVLDTNKNTLLLDAYNANPSSVGAVLDSFAKLQTQLPKLAILGDMLELGNISEREHANIILQATQLNIKTYFCGPLYHDQRPKESVHEFFADKNQLVEYLKKANPSGCHILIKGSRGMQLESLLEYL